MAQDAREDDLAGPVVQGDDNGLLGSFGRRGTRLGVPGRNENGHNEEDPEKHLFHIFTC
jgi:hypothetical protein